MTRRIVRPKEAMLIGAFAAALIVFAFTPFVLMGAPLGLGANVPAKGENWSVEASAEKKWLTGNFGNTSKITYLVQDVDGNSNGGAVRIDVSQNGAGSFVNLLGMNLTAAQNLVFRVRWSEGSNNGRFKIKLESNGGSCTSEIRSINFPGFPGGFLATATYQQVSIPLSSFSSPCNFGLPANRSNMNAWTLVSEGIGSTVMILYFDDIRFE